MSLNYVEALVDEIALEGLDGITLQALWMRLHHRKDFEFFLDDKSQNFLWNIVKRLRNIELFILPKARADLNLPSEDEDAETILLAVQAQMKQLYPHCMVDNIEHKGSCPTYHVRTPAPEYILSFSVEECQEKLGGRLVLVASQESRTFALMGRSKHPYMDIPANQYCVLERIGRSRHYGVLTYGPGSLLDMIKEDPRSHFYMRKKFLEQELITKQNQSVHTKSGTNNCYVLHLARFYTMVKSVTMLRQESILSVLRETPDHYMPYDKLKNRFGFVSGVFKKLMTLMTRRGLLDANYFVTYRTLYPNAKQYQWQNKNSGLEKSIRVVRLIEASAGSQNERLQVEDEPLNSDDEEEDADGNENSIRGFLDISQRTLDRTLANQVYKVVEAAGPEGLTQASVGKLLGLGKLERRMVCRYLVKEGAVFIKMQDIGRQRVSRYIAVRNQEKDTKFEAEKLKFIEIVGDSKILDKLLVKDVNNSISVIKHPREQAEDLFDKSEGTVSSENMLVPGNISTTISEQQDPQFVDTNIIACNDVEENADQLDAADIPIVGNISQPTPVEEEAFMTYRTLRRINIIMAEVLKYKVIDDLTKFYKLIQEDEKEDGYEYKVDRKSLHRLISKLQREKLVKLFKAVIKSDDKKRTLTFVCGPDIDKNHSSILGAIEQAKFRVFNVPELKPTNVEVLLGDPLLDKESIVLSVQEIQRMNLEANENSLAVKALEKERSNRYGHCPKFVRLQLLHKLLFYLTRCYQGSTEINHKEAVHYLQSQGFIVPQDLPKVYKLDEEIDWKMFIHPLPNHEGWPKGWTILCDVVLRIPLSMFVRIMWVRFVVPGLDAYLTHPIKQHYLLGHLPRSIRSSLLANRKFAFTLYETAQRLCFMGLIQFGPQRLKDKDQLFVYVNQRTSIMDTTPSDIGYFQISTNIQYERRFYTFSSLQDLEKYWCELYTTSVCTQLGGKVCQEGKEIILEALENKPAMQYACQARTAEEVVLHDDGSVPGDQLGAAGLDSAFFAHLKRNWNSKYVVLNTSSQLREHQDMEWQEEPSSERRVVESSRSKQIPDAQPSTSTAVTKKNTTFLKAPKKMEKIKKRKITRPVYKNKPIKERKPVGSKPAERTTWTAEEDVYLILCKVAGMFLSHESTKSAMKGHMVAKILEKYAPSEKPKDGIQCLRRMNYLYNRSESAQLDIAMCLEESHQDVVIIDKYWNFHQNLKAKKLTVEQYDAEVDKSFEDLVDRLKQKYRSIPDDMVLDTPIPDTLEEFYATFNVVNPLLCIKQRGSYEQPQKLEQIYFNTIITLIFSSLGTAADKTNYSLQLLNVYQQYPDKWLRAAINKLRNDQIVSSKKLFARNLKNKNSHIPLTSTPFQLAMYYFHMMQSKYQYELFSETWSALQSLRGAGATGVNLDVVADSGGRTACVLEGAVAGLVSLQIQIPAQILMLDFDPTIYEEEKKQLEEFFENEVIYTDKLETITTSTPLNAGKRALELSYDDGPATKLRKMEGSSDVQLGEDAQALGHINQQLENTLCDQPLLMLDGQEMFRASSVVDQEKQAKERLLEANVLARMKFYAIRDELRMNRPSYEGKDQRARLAMKPCELLCTYIADQMPIDTEDLKHIIRNIKSWNIIRGDISPWEDVVKVYLKAGGTTADITTASKLVEIIKTQKELGATTCLLRSSFSPAEMSLAKHLSILRSTNIVLRVGVTTLQYVHWCYKQPWLINSAKVTRLERETQNPLNAVMLDLKESFANEEELESEQVDVEQGVEASTSQQPASESLVDKIMVTKKLEKSNILSHSVTTAEEVARQLESSCGEKVLVAIRPWVRVDGSLNRRVLDRLMGAILCHLLYNPGCTLELLQLRFTPALQPYHTFELLEILQLIEAVKVYAIHTQGTVTLFSKNLEYKIEPADFTEPESSIFIEPAMDAILRMTQFIGNKVYATDFLDDVKARPYTETPASLIARKLP